MNITSVSSNSEIAGLSAGIANRSQSQKPAMVSDSRYKEAPRGIEIVNPKNQIEKYTNLLLLKRKPSFDKRA